MLKIGILLLCLGTTSGCKRLEFTEEINTANGYELLVNTLEIGGAAINAPKAMQTQTVLCPKDQVVTGVEAETKIIDGKKDRIYTLKCEGRCQNSWTCGFDKHWKYYYSRWSGKDENFKVGFDYKLNMNVKALIGFQSKLSDEKEKDDKETVYRSFRFFYAETTEWFYYHDDDGVGPNYYIPLLEWKTEKEWNKIIFQGRSWDDSQKWARGRNSAYHLKSYRKDGMRQFEFKTAHSSKEKH